MGNVYERFVKQLQRAAHYKILMSARRLLCFWINLQILHITITEVNLCTILPKHMLAIFFGCSSNDGY